MLRTVQDPHMPPAAIKDHSGHRHGYNKLAAQKMAKQRTFPTVRKSRLYSYLSVEVMPRHTGFQIAFPGLAISPCLANHHLVFPERVA